jgi:hypothetical protein
MLGADLHTERAAGIPRTTLKYSGLKTAAEKIGIEAVDRKFGAECEVPRPDAGGYAEADGTSVLGHKFCTIGAKIRKCL